MRAVFSWWSRPQQGGGVWISPFHEHCAWSLAVLRARRFFAHVDLVTDTPGHELLVEGLALPFDRVRLDLDAIVEADPGWWALGKLHAYRVQDGPFIHLDHDVFLRQALPDDLLTAPVCTQHPEDFVRGASCYRPETVELLAGWLPEEWRWYAASGLPQRGECCGLLGGNDHAFLRHYASQAIRALGHPANADAWRAIVRRNEHMILFEQYLLAACLAYHRAHADSNFHGVAVARLFPDWEQGLDRRRQRERGFTHLIGDGKRDPQACDVLVQTLAREHPEQYLRCWRAAASAA